MLGVGSGTGASTRWLALTADVTGTLSAALRTAEARRLRSSLVRDDLVVGGSDSVGTSQSLVGRTELSLILLKPCVLVLSLEGSLTSGFLSVCPGRKRFSAGGCAVSPAGYEGWYVDGREPSPL